MDDCCEKFLLDRERAVQAQEKRDADHHVLWYAMKRQLEGRWRMQRPPLQNLLPGSFRVAMKWSVATRLNVSYGERTWYLEWKMRKTSVRTIRRLVEVASFIATVVLRVCGHAEEL